MKTERFSIAQFNEQFPDDAACLAYIWAQRNPNGATCPRCNKVDRYTRVSTRKTYSCECGHQVSPCEGTIFHKSSTKLRTWFLAMFYMTASKNGVSACELERLTGVTYKTAFRMAHQIRKLMSQGTGLLSGVVEADETFIGGYRRNHERYSNKTPVAAMVQRGGEIRARVVTSVRKAALLPRLVTSVERGATIYTDELKSYSNLAKYGFVHATVEHGKFEYVRAEVHTNSIEGFWSQLKRSINGTFHQISRERLQAYVDEFSFRYNRRYSVTEAPIFPTLVERVGERHG